MGKITVSIPHVTWRDGRPRFIPGPRLRRLGFKGEDLRHPDGAWFDLDQARAWAADRQKLVASLAGKSPREKRRAVAGSGGISVGVMIEDWLRQPRMRGEAIVEGRMRREPLSPNTVRYYRNAANQLEALDEGRIWMASAGAITARTLDGVLHRLEVKHGLATARAARATLSGAYGWARRVGKVSVNPVAGAEIELPTLPPRIRYGSIAEMRALIAAADAIGLPEIGDAVMLGLWTGQRQGDRLALESGQITDNGMLFRQSKKHGQPLLIPQAPELARRLRAARERRAGWRVNYPHVVLDEGQRAPVDPDWYRKQFRLVRDAAVEGVPFAVERRVIRRHAETGRIKSRETLPPALERAAGLPPEKWLVPPCPSLSDFHDQDLRDTAVTWLALAGVDKFGIASITGHSLKSIDTILKHYLGLHPELARSAIATLVEWYEGETSK